MSLCLLNFFVTDSCLVAVGKGSNANTIPRLSEGDTFLNRNSTFFAILAFFSALVCLQRAKQKNIA